MLGAYHQHLKELLPSGLPPAVAAIVSNPLAPAKLKMQLAAALPQTGTVSADAVAAKVSEAMVQAIDGVFLIYAALVILTLIMSLWLEDRPLREANASGAD